MTKREDKPNQPDIPDGRLQGLAMEPTIREEVWGKSLTQHHTSVLPKLPTAILSHL